MPLSNKKRTFRRNTKTSNKSAKNNKSKRVGGVKKGSRKNTRNPRSTPAKRIAEVLSDAEIEELVDLLGDESRKPAAREMLKQLEYEDGYVSCYETKKDTENYRKNPRNLYKQGEDKLACWYNGYTKTIE